MLDTLIYETRKGIMRVRTSGYPRRELPRGRISTLRMPYLTERRPRLIPSFHPASICSSCQPEHPQLRLFETARRDRAHGFFAAPGFCTTAMAATCGTALSGARLDSKLASSFLPRTASNLSSSSSCGITDGAFKAVETRGVGVSMPARKSLQVVAMAPPKPAGKAKKVVGLVKLALEAGKATPAPPVGPALGSKGVNIMAFCKEYNAKTADKPGYIIPVEITVFDDRSFTFILKTPPASILLLKAAGAAKGSNDPQNMKVGKVTMDQLRTIAQEKLPDLNCTTIESAMRIVAGTAANMGIDIDPPLLVKKKKVVF